TSRASPTAGPRSRATTATSCGSCCWRRPTPNCTVGRHAAGYPQSTRGLRICLRGAVWLPGWLADWLARWLRGCLFVSPCLSAYALVWAISHPSPPPCPPAIVVNAPGPSVDPRADDRQLLLDQERNGQ